MIVPENPNLILGPMHFDALIIQQYRKLNVNVSSYM